jgi:excisionase family DNA binding protein
MYDYSNVLKDLFTVVAAAQELGKTEPGVRSLLRDGGLKSVKFGYGTLIPRDEIERFKAAH